MGYLNQAVGSFRRITSSEVEARRLIGSLTAVQLSVLNGLVDGGSLSGIATDIGLETAEVEKVRSEMLSRFEVGTTADLIRIALSARIQDCR